MKNILLFIVLILFFDKDLISQPSWSTWGKFNCFEGFSFRVMNKGFNKNVNKYEWIAEVKNNYLRKVHISMTWKVGTEEKSIGRFSLDPGSTTNAVSYYFTSSENYMYVSANNVCFGENWLSCDGTKNCYAICDNGVPNIPTDCNKKAPVDEAKQPSTNEEKNQTSPPSPSKKFVITKNPVTDGKYLAKIICRKAALDDSILIATERNDQSLIIKLEQEYEILEKEHEALNNYYQDKNDLWDKYLKASEAELKKICSYYFPS
jgi:hypothetical protein